MKIPAAMRVPIARVSGWLLGAVLATSATGAHAGAIGPCDDPFVYQGARVQVFILPLRAEGPLSERGRELVTLLQRHILHAALKYHSLGVGELTGDDEICSYERVTKEVRRRLAEGQSAIFLSGRIFEQRDALLLQTRVEFSVPGAPEVLSWNLGSGGDAATTATVPADPVDFAPRAIPIAYLKQLASAQADAQRMHEAPDPTSPFWELPSDPEARFGFVVLDERPGWMQVRLTAGAGEGWIRTDSLAAASDLQGSFPELHFIDGLIGYHLLRRPGATGAAGPGTGAAAGDRRTLQATLDSFDRYLAATKGRAESEARALAKVLQGNAVLHAAPQPWPTPQLQAAERHYLAARELAPTSTVANTFALACGSALCARGACSLDPDRLHEGFVEAVGRDPGSRELVGNLEQFYAAAQRGSLKVTMPADEIARQRELTQSVRAGMD
jgi:hypothetical protein